jgi:protocatechuate 3,4-dioxygenase beta subunit
MGSLWFSGVLPVGRAANASATVVQSFGAQNAGTGSATLSASPTAATTAGDLLVAVIRDRNSSALTLVSTVADTNAGDHWAKATSVAQGSQADGEIWYVTNAASLLTSQSVTVTVGGTKASTTAIAFTVLDVSGATAVALDVVATKGGSTQPASAGPTAATAQASEIAIADIGWNSGSVTVSGQTSGYSVLPTQQSTVSSTGTGEQPAYRLLSATGTQIYQATISASSAAWTAAIATFKVGTPTPPTITAFNPTNGVVGTSVVITGTGLTGASTVQFNTTTQPTYTVTDDSHITTTVPAGASTGQITVITPGGTANTSALTPSTFTVNPPPLPTITSFNPTSGPVGTSVQIAGTGFTGATAVKFNTTTQPTYTVISDIQITAAVPTGATTGQITVITPGGTATTASLTPSTFTVTTPPGPTISNFGPTSGPAGTSVVINGTGFTAASAVKFNTTNQPAYTVTSDSQISTTVPNGATTGPIAVTVAGVTATSSTSFVVNSASNAPHIMVIVEENHSYNGTHGIIGNAKAPYTNSLATTYMSATNWFGQVHGSPPDYQALIAGEMLGSITKPSSLPTLVDELVTAGISWKAYMETMPSTCDLAGTNDLQGYASDHNPFLYYASTRTPAQCQNVVPYTQFATDANTTTPPAFMFMVPNQCNDMHTECGGTNVEVVNGDNWLKTNLPLIQASTWYQQGGTVIITWDEADPTDSTGFNGSTGGHIPTIVVSAATKVGSSHTFSSGGNLYGILRGVEERYGVPLLASTSTAVNGDLSGALGPATVGAISGTVTDSQTPAQPVGGATVSYTGTKGSGSITTTSTGGYTLSGITPGTYTVSASDAGFTSPSSQPVTVTAGTTATANFTLIATSGISGAVSDSQTTPQPIGGATVQYTGTGSSTGSGTTTTNTGGGYAFNGVPPGTYTVTASHTGYTSPAAQPVSVTTAVMATANITLAATSGIGGTVSDTQAPAQPVSGASVSYTGTGGTAGSGTTTANSSGGYTFSGVSPGTYSVAATATGFTSPSAQPVTVASGGTATANLTLTATSGISGAVNDSQATPQPISGASVHYAGTGGTTGSGTMGTDLSGSYTFSGVPPGTYSVTASATGFTSPAADPITVTAGVTATANFTMSATSGISGTVTDSETPAQAVSGATVAYTGTGGTTGSGSTTTGAGGTYSFSGVPPGTYSVTATETGFTSPAAQPVTVTAGVIKSGVDFTLNATSGISGTVTDGTLPIGSATVSYSGTGGSNGSGSIGTAVDGTYALSGVPPGTYTVTASAAAYGPQSKPVTVTVSTTTIGVDFTLTATTTGTISGTVSDSQTPARAVSGATVTYVDTNNSVNTGNVLTDSSGGYSFSGLSTGSYSVSVTDSDFTTPAAQPVTVTAGGTATATFTMTATSGISGTVSDSQTPAQSVGGATVSYSGTGGTTGAGTTTTDSTGTYAFNGVPPGTYSVTVTKTGFTSPAAQTPTVASGSTATVNFTLSATSGISGAVTDSQAPAQPVSGATVSYTGTGGTTGSGTTTTSSSGGYTFNGVPPGTYSVTASRAGFTSPAAQTPAVTSGVSATANFILTANSGIGGTVSDQASAPVNGATVSYTGTGGTTGSGTTTTNSSGVYALNGVPSGTYSVSASDTGYTSPAAQAVTVTSGATTSGVNFTLTSSSHQPIFSDGFESGNLSAWTKTQNMTVETTTVHGPTHAVQGVSTSTSTATTAYAQKTLSATYTTSYTRVWFWIVSDSGQQANLLRVRGTTNSNTAFVFVSSTGFLSLNNGTAAVKSTTPVTTGAWHELELNVVTGTSASTQVWLDGSLVTALTGSGLTNLATPIQTIQIGEAGLQTWTANFDDVAFDTQMIP